MSESFFVPLSTGSSAGERWQSTVHTTGPWDARFQHGGPPSALLARAVETCEPRAEMTVVRATVEILGPVPVAELSLRVRVVRPGRSVELLEAALAAGGRDVARMTAWRVLRTSAPAVPPRHAGPPPVPQTAVELPAQGAWAGGYSSAVEWRPVAGQVFAEPGPSTVWTRLRHPLVPDEEPSGLQRVMAVADSGNGVSGELDLRQWHFINPELTVHLHREAGGEWVCLDAATTISPGGAGLATSVLSDTSGPVGVGAQALLVAPRPPA